VRKDIALDAEELAGRSLESETQGHEDKVLVRQSKMMGNGLSFMSKDPEEWKTGSFAMTKVKEGSSEGGGEQKNESVVPDRKYSKKRRVD